MSNFPPYISLDTVVNGSNLIKYYAVIAGEL